MSSKASGDGPQPSNEHKRILQRKDDIYSWKMSYEAWQTFNDLRNKGLFYDVTLLTDDGESFPAHRIVLCTCGHYFRSLFSGRWKSSEQGEIQILGVKSAVMKRVIHFAYTRRIVVRSIPEARELLIAGSHFGVDEIIKICSLFLASKMTAANCVEIWEFSRVYYCRELESRAFMFILENFKEILAFPDAGTGRNLYNISGDDLSSIISHDELNITSEKLALRVIFRWLDRALPRQRVACTLKLLSSVRLALLKPSFLEKFLRKNKFVQSLSATRCFTEKLILIAKLNESSGEDKKLLTAFLHNSKHVSPTVTKNFPFTTQEREMFRKLARPRSPREILLVVGGWSGNAPTASSEAFDPGTKRWNDTNLAFPNLLKKPRAYHGVCYLGGYLYVVGGFDGQLTYNSCERYSLASGKWKKMCGMHHRRCYVGVATLNGLIYAIGGSEGSGEHLRMKSAERYDANVNVWTRLPDMTERRSDAGVCGLNGRMYVAGGFTGHQCVFSVEYFDTELYQWCRIAPMRIRRSGVTVIAYKERILALGGFDGNSTRLNSVEAFDPCLNLWTTLPDMLTGRSNFGACVISGKLTVMGGFNGLSTCGNVEYFNDEEENDEAYFLQRESLPPNRAEDNETGEVNQAYEGNGSGDNEEERIAGLSLPRHAQSISFVNPEVPTGVWRRLPDMKVARSALSCCIVDNLPPPFLRSAVAPLEPQPLHAETHSERWADLDKLMAMCIENTFDD